METTDETYEFDFEKVDKNSGIRIDVIATPAIGKVDMSPYPPGMIGLAFMSEDKGEGKGHENWGYIQFKSKENLKRAQMGLELLQEAIIEDEELSE